MYDADDCLCHLYKYAASRDPLVSYKLYKYIINAVIYRHDKE